MGDDKCGTNVEQEGDGQFPLVLQCSQCNLIVGDSKSWVSANNSLKSITLKCKCLARSRSNSKVTKPLLLMFFSKVFPRRSTQQRF